MTTVEDTFFVVLTDVFVSRNRSKGASIDDRSAREIKRRKKKAKEGTRIARQSGEGCGSARFLFEEGLFVEQTENASEALAKREKPAAISRGEKEMEEKRYASPILLDKRAERPLFIFRPQHNILLRKAARVRHDLRAAVPLPFAIALWQSLTSPSWEYLHLYELAPRGRTCTNLKTNRAGEEGKKVDARDAYIFCLQAMF